MENHAAFTENNVDLYISMKRHHVDKIKYKMLQVYVFYRWIRAYMFSTDR